MTPGFLLDTGSVLSSSWSQIVGNLPKASERARKLDKGHFDAAEFVDEGVMHAPALGTMMSDSAFRRTMPRRPSLRPNRAAAVFAKASVGRSRYVRHSAAARSLVVARHGMAPFCRR